MLFFVTAAGDPIAVSNISNLIALKIVGLTLNDYVLMMFIPSMIGIFVIVWFPFWYFKKNIPKVYSMNPFKLELKTAKEKRTYVNIEHIQTIHYV